MPMLRNVVRLRGQLAVNNGLASRRASSLLPLEEEFPGSPVASPSGLPKPIIKTSTLPNGIKVVSLDNGDKSASFGIMVNSGSRDEAIPEFGATLVLQRMAFKSTTERSSIRLNRDLQDVGITVSCTGGREQMLYTAEGLPNVAGVAIKALAETVTSPLMRPWEVKAVQEKIVDGIDRAEFNMDPSAMLYEAIHAAAFDPVSPLGHPLFAHCEVPHEAFRGLLESRVGPGRLTLAAIGISHDEIMNYAGSLLGDVGVGSAKQPSLSSSFVGGTQRVHTSSGADTHLALVFQGPVVGDKDTATYMVLEHLLGSHGKIGHSTFQVLSAAYSDAGVFAITGVDSALKSHNLAESMANVVTKLANTPITPDDLNASIASARMKLLTSHASHRAMLSTLAVGAKMDGNVVTLEELNAVTSEGVQKVVAKLLKGKLALAAVGDMRAVPRLDDVKMMF